VTALLLAREVLPGRFAPEPDRPVVAGFWPVLHDALVAPREILVLRGHEDRVVSAGFSPDGTRIVTASSDNTARVWPLVQDLPELARLAWQHIAPVRSLSGAQKQRFFIEDALPAAHADSP
jgi:WD40 repeat protein